MGCRVDGPGLPADVASRLDAMRAAATPAGGSGPGTGNTTPVSPIRRLGAASYPQLHQTMSLD